MKSHRSLSPKPPEARLTLSGLPRKLNLLRLPRPASENLFLLEVDPQSLLAPSFYTRELAEGTSLVLIGIRVKLIISIYPGANRGSDILRKSQFEYRSGSALSGPSRECCAGRIGTN